MWTGCVWATAKDCKLCGPVLRNWCVRCSQVKRLMAQHGDLNREEPVPLGFTFSFAIDQKVNRLVDSRFQ